MSTKEAFAMSLTADQVRQLMAATHRPAETILEVYRVERRRKVRDSTVSHISEHAARLGYPLPPNKTERVT